MKGNLSIYFNIPNPVNQNNGSVTLKYKEHSINIPFSDIVHMKIDYAAKALNQLRFYCHNLDDVFEQQLINDFKAYLTIEMQHMSDEQDYKVFVFDCDMDGVYFDILVENLDDVIVLFKNIVNKQQDIINENEANYHSQNTKSSSTSIIPRYIDKNLICVFIDKDTYLNPDENVYEYINFSHMKSFNIKHSITTHYHLDFFDYSEHSCELQDENMDLVTFIMDDGSEIPVSSMKNIHQSMFQVLFNTEQSGTFSCYVMMFYNKLTELLKL